MEDLVSVIIPAYNAERYLPQTIESVLAQTYKQTEIIIVDDGSTDNTAAIVDQYNKNNRHIKILRQVNSGASHAKQKGFEASTGNFIQYLDADDLLDSDKLEKQVKALKRKPKAIAVSRTVHFFNSSDYKTNNIPEPEHYFEKYLKEPLKFLIRLYGGMDMNAGMIQPNAFLIPRQIAEKAGRWNTELSPSPDEDGEYFCRIILASNEIIFNSDTINYYRKFAGKRSLSAIADKVALRNLAKSFILKGEHLIAHCDDTELVEKINYTTFRSLFELEVRCYPQYPDLVSEIRQLRKPLSSKKARYKHVLGGQVINFLANNISWKLARRIQVLIAKLR